DKLQIIIHKFFREFFLVPRWFQPLRVRQNPYLIEGSVLIFEIMLRVANARSRTHNLHIARLGAAGVAGAILMADRSVAHIIDYFHIAVRVGIKAGMGFYYVVIDNAQCAKSHAFGVVIFRETEMEF